MNTSTPEFTPQDIPQLSPSKPFKEYLELVNHLKSKGMTINDETRAVRKLSQIGYYRLSGYWHVCRIPILNSENKPILNPINQIPEREDTFFKGTSFEEKGVDSNVYASRRWGFENRCRQR